MSSALNPTKHQSAANSGMNHFLCWTTATIFQSSVKEHTAVQTIRLFNVSSAMLLHTVHIVFSWTKVSLSDESSFWGLCWLGWYYCHVETISWYHISSLECFV